MTCKNTNSCRDKLRNQLVLLGSPKLGFHVYCPSSWNPFLQRSNHDIKLCALNEADNGSYVNAGFLVTGLTSYTCAALNTLSQILSF